MRIADKDFFSVEGKKEINGDFWHEKFIPNFSVKTKTSKAQGLEEYTYQVSLTYDHWNFEKNWGNPKKYYKLWGRGEIIFRIYG